MIATETEALVRIYENDQEFDQWFPTKKKRKERKPKTRLSSEERAARKERRRNTFADIDNTIRDNGGIDGIADSLGNVFGMFKKKQPSYQGSSDFQVGLGNQNPPPKPNHTGVYVVGGLLAASLIAFGVLTYTKYKAIP